MQPRFVVKVLPGKAQILPQTFPFSVTALQLQRAPLVAAAPPHRAARPVMQRLRQPVQRRTVPVQPVAAARLPLRPRASASYQCAAPISDRAQREGFTGVYVLMAESNEEQELREQLYQLKQVVKGSKDGCLVC
ncbi:hypothetical protein [Mixta intestinalis]|uniref:Uncharacterized protein n=1 Tax=Mixta intestinalis TaxID=1615494 RepID=A0A6P1PUX8_9GAMM|nr:hypothetical protein C7M51_00200 [Mixta intestinalis]